MSSQLKTRQSRTSSASSSDSELQISSWLQLQQNQSNQTQNSSKGLPKKQQKSSIMPKKVPQKQQNSAKPSQKSPQKQQQIPSKKLSDQQQTTQPWRPAWREPTLRNYSMDRRNSVESKTVESKTVESKTVESKTVESKAVESTVPDPAPNQRPKKRQVQTQRQQQQHQQDQENEVIDSVLSDQRRFNRYSTEIAQMSRCLQPMRDAVIDWEKFRSNLLEQNEQCNAVSIRLIRTEASAQELQQSLADIRALLEMELEKLTVQELQRLLQEKQKRRAQDKGHKPAHYID
ncbi:hypothetical protein BOX15_Mlig021889g1 [Macrostomum lignano]|uniref:Uncharacterized protein n=1 Tax=Macrostomum lignano TaxID=282301 RepID=A0A267H012_9PLAT|nr:hypothetical protein BOX15_Mlig021889g1 [Macrostomum lignano]